MKAIKYSIVMALLLSSPFAQGDDGQCQIGNSGLSKIETLERTGTAESQFQSADIMSMESVSIKMMLWQ